ncbi:uracil-DNA glycosylase family protein [Thetidibacter halocola]|uniref:Uracil-DNA glycosylase n=1 Tax=Thetidibacter halocola TaxID=2827239 RepID=A0A8J7WHH6_9RHOB|nr:uracil-DNA glycosylase family protein [Thetidibacter halocola]MBS0126524.1 hypothetical protein [Thetidibacter halocola]
MAALRNRMEDFLADWRNDLPNGWLDVFNEIEPDLASIPQNIQIDIAIPVFPGRRNNPIGGAPHGAHLFRAFDGIERNGVRVVVLGRDPYPVLHSATGRAFEDGAWNGEPTQLADSLKCLVQSAITTNGAELAVPDDTANWPAVRQAVQRGQVVLPQLDAYFNGLAQQGVLFVNSSLTRTREEDFKHHLALWKPFLNALIRNLSSDQNVPVVFLLLGEDAQRRFCSAEPLMRNSALVSNAHPSRAQHYYKTSNPLLRTNTALMELGADEIVWWPQV